MFKVIDHKLYFRDLKVGNLEGLLGTTLFDSLVYELENHTPVEGVESMIKRLAELEKPEKYGDPAEILGAVWTHV